MTLRQRTLLMIGIAVVALNAALYAIASRLLLRNVYQAEDQMPSDWRQALQQAASRANTKQLLNRIAQIPPSQAHVAAGLTELVNDFCFEEIVALL